jgi:Maltokinase N-terminal cap domain
MALLHQAELNPSKTELLDTWVPSQPWFVGDVGHALASVGAFRFDDPEGEVGVETLLVRAGNGPVLQVPVTYRGAPLSGAESSLMGTMEHSVLGKRWVYDGAGDPVYLLTTAAAALTGGVQAPLFVDIDGQRVERKQSALITATGTSEVLVSLPAVLDVAVQREGRTTVVETPEFQLVIQRVLDGSLLERSQLGSEPAEAEGMLLGTWAGAVEPQELVLVSFH